MSGIERVAATLGDLVDSGKLVGYAVGVREDGRSRVVAGGTSVVGGTPMSTDAVFPLSSNTKPVGGVLAMRLVELGVLGLDDPVDGYLPELAEPRVVARPDGPLDHTEPAERPITLRHLLTMTAGFGWVGESAPLGLEMGERQIAPGPYAPPMAPDEYMRRLGSLPLAGQPGRGWNYHNCSDVLGVLLARATDTPLGALLDRHITGPLGMTGTGFTADPGRLVTTYVNDDDGTPRPSDNPNRFGRPPELESLACGLTSTVDDYLLLLESLVSGPPVLTPDSATAMCTDQLGPELREAAGGFLGPGCGYGFQVEVRPGGTVGWAGGLGTIGYADRRSGRAAAVFTNQAFDVDGTSDALDTVWALLS